MDMEERFAMLCALSSTPYDDMAMVIVPAVKKMALDMADKIDGEEG